MNSHMQRLDLSKQPEVTLNLNYSGFEESISQIRKILIISEYHQYKKRVPKTYSRVPNCKGGLFSVFSIFCLQYHFIMTPPFYDFLSQVVQFDSISYINLSKIHHLHFIMTPAFSEIFNLCRPPLTNRPPPTIRYTRVAVSVLLATLI